MQASQLRHSNGAPLLEIYGNHARPDGWVPAAASCRAWQDRARRHVHPKHLALLSVLTLHTAPLPATPTGECLACCSAKRQGSTLTFSLLDPSGRYLSWRAAAQAMMEAGLHVREEGSGRAGPAELGARPACLASSRCHGLTLHARLLPLRLYRCAAAACATLESSAPPQASRPCLVCGRASVLASILPPQVGLNGMFQKHRHEIVGACIPCCRHERG